MIDEMPAQQEDSPVNEWSPRFLYIRALVTGLNSPFVPFAVLKHDPMPEFQRALEQLHYQGMPPDEETLQALWNAPLHALASQQRYFLMAWSSVAAAPPLMANLSGLSFGIATPGPHYTRWITTEALQYGDELVAWCEPVDMRGIQEEVFDIALTEEGMIRLSNIPS